MKTYPIPDALLAAAVNLIERLPATRDVRAVLNGLESCVTQHDRAAADEDSMQELVRRHKGQPSTKGGGGPGEPEDKKKA